MASTGTHPAVAVIPESTLTDATQRRRWVDLGLVLLVGFAPLVLSGIYQWVVPVTGTAATTNFRLSSGLVHEGATLTLFLVLLRRQGRSVKEIGLSWQWLDLPKAAGLLVLSYMAMILCNGIIEYAHFWWTGSWVQTRSAREIFAGASMIVFVLYNLAAPVFEETLVRGYLMTELIGLSWPAWLAALASVALQTSYHLYYGLAGALSVGAAFAVFAIYYALTRRLLPVLFAHLLWA
jgi:membrane protease YdiL (CAAX protease family)